MLRFVINKLISKRWLALCLLIGDILLVAVASSNPLYSDAILHRALTRNLSNALVTSNAHPAEISVSRGVSNDLATRGEFVEIAERVMAFPQKWGIEAVEQYEEHSITTTKAVLLGVRSNGKPGKLSVGCMSDLEAHVEIIQGKYMSDAVENGIVEAIISQALQQDKNYLIGDEYVVHELVQDNGEPYRVKIVGIYTGAEGSEIYWNKRTSYQNSNVLISEQIFKTLVGDYCPTSKYTFYLDYTKITPNHIEQITKDFETTRDELIEKDLGQLSENLLTKFNSFLPEATKFRSTLTVLYAPIFALLAAFIFMVSRQLMDLEENEIAVIVSRGSKKWQIIMIYFIQAAFMSVFGVIFGYPLGYLICHLLGASNAFLEFVQREALPLSFSVNSFLFACGAAVVACAFMTMPVFRYANRSIVQYKVQRQDQNIKPFWQKIFLDIILLAVSLYALYSFGNQRDNLIENVILGESLDPLLYFSSSIFILGAGLLGIRLVPYLIQLVFSLGKRFWSPSVYTAFLRAIRTKNQQSFIMLFLILTISLGIFNASSARTINGNAENSIVYMNAADVVVQDEWLTDSKKQYIEPSFEKYNHIEGVQSKTKVYISKKASIQGASGMNNIMLMGINTREFGETANFDETLLPAHWYHYLNAISQDPSGVLISANLAEKCGYELGDVLAYRDEAGAVIRGIIYGFVDYWPGYAPKTMSVNKEGNLVESTNYLIVASLSQLQVSNGLRPYQVWMRVEGSTQPVYDYCTENRISFKKFTDTNADLIALKNEPLFQGTNGVLTANFIIVLMLCMAGFLIYWVLSIRSRELQFGIFRAMGLSMREILSMLAMEQILISGSSIVIGVGVGALVTRLYLPLIQIAYSAADQVIPLQMISDAGDSVRLFGAIGAMVAVCMVVLIWLISKIRIAQALKLGED